MSRFERENISKKVKVVSQVFAVLASFGILIIGLQLFSKTTGFDIFNINYSLSKLFSEETESKVIHRESISEYSKPFFEQDIIDPDNSEALIKAASFLQNQPTLLPIKPSQSGAGNDGDSENKKEKHSIIEIPSLLSSGNLFPNIIESFKSKQLSQNGILPTVKEAKFSKWSVGISLSPGVSYRQIKYTNVDEISTRQVGNTQFGFYQTKKERNKLDKALMKYSLALDFFYRVNSTLSFQSGLIYFNTGESIMVKEKSLETNNPTLVADNSFFEGSPDFEAPDGTGNEDNVRFANNFSYFEIPLIINYKIKSVNELTDLELQAGASLTKLDFVTAMVYNFENNGYYLISGSHPSIFQKYGSNAIAGIIYSKYITNTIQLYANPQLKVGLTNIFNKEYHINEHYYNAVVRLGMKINL